jgi:hypothetical protein
MTETRRINMWSGPRNLSTALMYSFRERADTTVVDEPLYVHYLSTTGLWHPGREDVLESMDNDGDRVVRDQMLGPWPTPIVFFKQMAHHLVGLNWDFLDETTNVILTRDPRFVLASFAKQVEDVTPDTTGLPMCIRLVDRLIESGKTPVVVDSRQLLSDPPQVLAALCDVMGVPFDPAMLSWDAGSVPEDGVWSVHWYANTHASTGFAPYQHRDVELPPAVEVVAEACAPMYDRLLTYAIGAS